MAGLTGTEAYVALRTRYRRHLLDLAVRDLGAASPTDVLPAVGRELADLAGAALEAVVPEIFPVVPILRSPVVPVETPVVPGARVADRKSTRLNSSHSGESRMPSSA